MIFCFVELLVTEPYLYKTRSTEKGKEWETIAINLNDIQNPKFKVTSRSVRDHYTLITYKKAQQLKEEEKASGIDVTPTELDILLEEILEKQKAAKAEIASGDMLKKNAEKDRASAENIRKQAMERMSETRKREEDDDDDEEIPAKKKKTRRSSHEMFGFLEQKVAMDHAIKQEELECRKKEQEAIEKREREKLDQQEKRAQQQNDTMVAMMEQQQQQQQQLQNLQAMFLSQQQQQTQAMMAMLEKTVKK